MLDQATDKGILVHGLQQLFEEIDMREAREKRIFIVKCSYFEIYNDQVFDLLNEEFATTHTALQVIEDPKRKEFFVRNLREVIVENLDECISLLKLGEMNRSYAATKMNHQSSRSHALYRLSVQSMPKRDPTDMPVLDDDDKKSCISQDANISTQAVINFIDLAGSERASVHETGDSASIPVGATVRNPSPFGSTHRSSSKSQAGVGTGGAAVRTSKNMRIKEGQHINKSLFFLT